MPPGDPAGPAPDTPDPALDTLVQSEARRLAAESRLQANPALLAEGWERRFVIEGARVAEYVRLYESLGFEVIAEPVHAEGAQDDCTDCRIIAFLEFRLIYTRAKQSNAARTPPAHPIDPRQA